MSWRLCARWAEEQTERGKVFSNGQHFYEHFHLRLRDFKKEVLVFFDPALFDFTVDALFGDLFGDFMGSGGGRSGGSSGG